MIYTVTYKDTKQIDIEANSEEEAMVIVESFDEEYQLRNAIFVDVEVIKAELKEDH